MVNVLTITAILSSVWIVPWFVIAGIEWCGRNHPVHGVLNRYAADWMLGLK